jgi:hypothetical protein
MTTPHNALFLLERVGDHVQPRVVKASTVLAPFGSSRNEAVITVG